MYIRICGVIVFLIGIIVIVREFIKKKKYTSIVDGKVVDIFTTRSNPVDNVGNFNRKVYVHFHPVLEYTVDGNVYVKKSISGLSYNCYFIGQKIKIHYNPVNPNKNYIKSELDENISIGVILTVLGIVLMTIL